jgi:spore germination protein YaaH
LHERLPRLRVQAWLGQVEAGGGGPLDLGQEDVRAQVVSSARRFMDLGYDGVHYDIEPIWAGDDDFLSLLEATSRAAHAEGKVVSIAAEELPLFVGADRAIGLFIPRYHPWTLDYYRRVAAHVDQLAVMTYDSAVPTAHLYQRFVARNTRLLAAALQDDVQLLIGVPSYADWNIGHWPGERPANALHGLRRGLARVGEDRRGRVGWALYAEWTTDPSEWTELSEADA